ncbi:MAG: DUF814 domain-containing protein [Deltaproteobacteria bacterium]|nr:MAG: DUF814 domain-containing protein [Deltaproteobacteria bacterium]
MSLSTREFQRVLDAHADELAGARIQRVRAPDDHTLLLTLHRAPTTREWLVSLRSPLCRVHPTTRRLASTPQPSAFVMLLRKHLTGARVIDVERPTDDRWIRLHTRRGDERASLVIALLGRDATVLLLDAQGHVLGDHAGRRATGALHVPPSPPSTRAAPDHRDRFPVPDAALAEAIDAHYARRAEDIERTTAIDRRRHALRRERRRAERLRDALLRDLERVDEAPALRHRADLLQTARGRVRRGDRSVTVQDWAQPDSPEVILPLDPALDLEAQIARAYHQARRLERGADTVLRRLEEAEGRVGTFAGLEEQLARVEDSGDWGALPDLLGRIDEALPGRARGRARGARRAAPAPRLPYIRYRASDGTPILVGRGGRDNDTLTVQIAHGHDLWLHAEDWAGAHVVIRRPRGATVRPEVVEEAALLAAHHSRGRSDTVVGVRVTERRHVRKARDLPPGRVLVAGGRTVEVSPSGDPRLPALLARREDAAG